MDLLNLRNSCNISFISNNEKIKQRRIGIKKTEAPTMKHYSNFLAFVLLCLFLFSFHRTTIALFALKLHKPNNDHCSAKSKSENDKSTTTTTASTTKTTVTTKAYVE